MQSVKEQIGEELYEKLNTVAEAEVVLAMQFQIEDEYHQKHYYQRKPLLNALINEFFQFEERGLKFTPCDIVYILFWAKLQRACSSQDEYEYRSDEPALLGEAPFIFDWSEKSLKLDDVIESHLNALSGVIYERQLGTVITNFHTSAHLGDPAIFFHGLFAKLMPQFDFRITTQATPASSNGRHEPETGMLSFKVTGTRSYAYYYAQAHLRTFLSLLRIIGFIYPGQIDKGMWDIVMMAPTGPIFLNTSQVSGGYSWEEDERKPWEKIPDGCLFLSFGFRSITNLFLDIRTFSSIERFFLEKNIVFNVMKNPWSHVANDSIYPSLDILSSATQIPDLGAKILQIYCCLEHLFVPKDNIKENTKFIIGAINALDPSLIDWFKRLYKMRCDYAHKGYIQKDDKTLGLVSESMQNIMKLLVAKLKLANGLV